MNFDEAKENIQPLAQGRNPSILQASIKEESHQELMAQRKQLEREIHNYKGEDPLSAWYTYIEWIEQSFPTGGKESGLQEVLGKCLTRFESDERYFQDRRMIRLYIKYIDSVKNPAECYQQLFNAGIGTMVSDFYIAWAYCYDLVNNTVKADEIFKRGIACRAQPLEELQEAHQHFGFTVSQRIMYKDDDNIKEETKRQLYERRQALSTLRGHRRKQEVGSIRTGAAVKNATPGTVSVENVGPSTSHKRSNNSRVGVYTDQNACPNVDFQKTEERAADGEQSRSVVSSIIDAKREQENLKEPGPWNKPYQKGKLFSKSKVKNELGFEIHEDGNISIVMQDEENYMPPIIMQASESRYDKPIRLPIKFYSRNKPQADWNIPVTTEECRDQSCIAEYNKCQAYPRPNMEFQPEEYKAYLAFKKRNKSNKFTQKREMYWGLGPLYNIRTYPHFAKQSKPQKLTELDKLYMPPKISGLQLPFDDIYNEEEQIERQYEEILSLRIKRNETIVQTIDMEETICVSSERVQRRKSFYPNRRSLAPCANPNRGATRKVSILPGCVEENEEKANESAIHTTSTNRSCTPAIFEDREVIVTPKLLSKITCQQNAESLVEGNDIQVFKQLTADTQGTKETTPLLSTVTAVSEQEARVIYKEIGVKRQVEFDTIPCNEKQQINTPKISPTRTLPLPVEIAKPATLPQTFTIYQDGSFEAKSKVVNSNDGFEFKTPALPIAGTNPPSVGIPKPSIMKFEICEDVAGNNAAAKPVSDSNCGNGGYFDADESCSTQTFNIFLKAQSVSTPKPKTEPQRQFGNILKETLPTPAQPCFEFKEDEPQSGIVPLPSLAEPNDENSPIAGNTVFSPQRKQLSTILETSENGTTHSTHTTGATTKSTLSSPEFEQESQAHNLAGKSHVPTLDTVRERTLEASINQTTSSTEALEEKLNSMKIENQYKLKQDDCTHSKTTPPGIIRSDIVANAKSNGLNFSIYEDTMNKGNGKVGDFSRLVERDETATGYPIKNIQFQEDKTETITKMMLTSAQPVRFQEDKTETIPAMLLAPAQPVQFQEDKTETISKMLLAPPEPIRFQEDKTETITKLLLAPPQPVRFEDERTEMLPQLAINETSAMCSNSRDDLFEFFSQSPPKLGKNAGSNVVCQIRSAAENRTPLSKDSKRFCAIETPAKYKQVSLFANTAGGTAIKPNSIPRDSFMPDFSIIEDSQPKLLPKSRAVLRDSSMPDFSIIENSQPEQQKIAPKVINHSDFHDLSHIPETQHNPSRNDSYIPETQPLHLSMRTGKTTPRPESSFKNVVQTSFLPDFSCIPETQQLAKSNEGQPSGLKNILTDTFMKDFSEIKEPPPIPMDVKEMTMLQPSKNNSTLKYLEESLSHKYMTKTSASQSGDAKETKTSLSKNSMEGKKISQNEKFFELNSETEMFGTNNSMIRNSTMLPQQGALRKTMTSKQMAFPISENSSHDKRHPSLIPRISNNRSAEVYAREDQPSLLTRMPSNRVTEVSALLRPSKQSISQIQQESLHIKEEKKGQSYASLSSSLSQAAGNQSADGFLPPQPVTALIPKPNISLLEKSKHVVSPMSTSRFSIEISQSELEAINKAKQQQNQNRSRNQESRIMTEHDNDDFGEMSIYYNKTPKTPKAQVHVWDIDECAAFKSPTHNRYTYVETDLNQTMQLLENVRMDPKVNPFSVELINAFLEQIQFTNYIKNIPHCMLVGCIHRLKAESEIKVNAVAFKVIKLIGEGAYGAIFIGKETITNKKIAMKQEKPANLWEYYICLEIQDRIRIDEMLPAFMSVDFALIGNNCSVLISQYSQYGSLIAVCNKIKKQTLKNVDEYVVMVMACELLEIIDHLHAVSIIHADIKADNFLLMNKLTYPPKERSLQLIDFGVSIDMKLFKPNQTFSYIHSDNAFKCVEMREQRPWTYQLDLYGLAGVLHVLLFGKYMEITQKPSGIWMHKTHVPRYFNRDLWENIFKALLNIRDCNSMPNLQGLRALLKEEIEEKEKYVTKMMNEFNRALDM